MCLCVYVCVCVLPVVFPTNTVHVYTKRDRTQYQYIHRIAFPGYRKTQTCILSVITGIVTAAPCIQVKNYVTDDGSEIK